jgi:hypothetical protein
MPERVTVRVLPGKVVLHYGKTFRSGEELSLPPENAERLTRAGKVERI